MIIPSFLHAISSPILVINTAVAVADNTPAAVNWTNTGPTARPAKATTTITTIGQQITGIDTSIILTVTNSTSNIIGTFQYGTNTTNTTPATFTQIITGAPIVGTNTVSSSFTVNNNDWLFFRYTIGSSVGGWAAGTTTLTVTNTSDANATLDTWTHTNT